MASDLFSVVTTAVGLGIKLKSSIDKLNHNRKIYQRITARIIDSLKKLRTACRDVATHRSPELSRALGKLKLDLEKALKELREPPVNQSLPTWRQWFQRDEIELILLDVEKQIVHCFQVFTAMSNIRIEKTLGASSLEVNRKLDELLRRTPQESTRIQSPSRPVKLAASPKTPKVEIKMPTPFFGRKNSSSSTRTRVSSSLPSATPSSRITRRDSLPDTIPQRSQPSRTSSSPTVTTLKRHPTPRIRAASAPANPGLALSSSSSTNRDQSLKDQARTLEENSMHLREGGFYPEAIIPARRAVDLRRAMHAANPNLENTAALARALTSVSRCQKYVTPQSDTEYKTVLSPLIETKELFRAIYLKDRSFRLDLAVAQYNLSLKQSDFWTRFPRQGTYSLYEARMNAEEALEHFKALEKESSSSSLTFTVNSSVALGSLSGYKQEVASAYLNLSYILTDLSEHNKALSCAQQLVEASRRLDDIQFLRTALKRLSFCFRNLGWLEKAKTIEREADALW